MKERDFQVAFSHYLKKKKPLTGVYELKISHKDHLPFNAVKEHQVNALLEAERDGFYHKISDSSFGLKPFDTVWLARPLAYVAILWYTPRKRKFVTLIRIKRFVALKGKNLTFDTAQNVAEISLNLQ